MSQSVEVVIITYNSLRYLRDCLNSILENGALPVVVDNGSKDGTLEVVRDEYPGIKIVSNPANGYGKAQNIGMGSTTGQYVILANVDVIFGKGSISKLISFLDEHPDVGVCGPQQMTPAGKWQRSYGRPSGLAEAFSDLLGVTSFHNGLRKAVWPYRIDRKPKDVPYVDGAVLAVKREACEAIGGFEEAYFFYSDESDFCVRLQRAGWRTVTVPAAEVIHYRGGDTTKLAPSSTNYVWQLIKSKAAQARKTESSSSARWYMVLELWHSRKMLAIFALLRHLVPGSRRSRFAFLYEAWKVAVEAWKKELGRTDTQRTALQV